MALALDGSNTSSAATVTLTTSNVTDVIVLIVSYSTADTLNSVSDNSGTSAAWQKRVGVTNGTWKSEEWWTTTTGAWTGATVTLNFNLTPGLISTCVFGVSGANTSSPFDVNGSLPSTDNTGATSVTFSTTAVNTFVVGASFAGSGGGSPPAGWTNIAINNFQGVNYKIYSSSQTGTVFTPNTGSQFNIIVDALVQAGGVADVLMSQIWI